jgi:hypothetical protein
VGLHCSIINIRLKLYPELQIDTSNIHSFVDFLCIYLIMAFRMSLPYSLLSSSPFSVEVGLAPLCVLLVLSAKCEKYDNFLRDNITICTGRNGVTVCGDNEALTMDCSTNGGGCYELWVMSKTVMACFLSLPELWALLFREVKNCYSTPRSWRGDTKEPIRKIRTSHGILYISLRN